MKTNLRAMKCFSMLLFFLAFRFQAAAQDTEFPREFIMHLKLHNGMVGNFSGNPELYVGGLQIVPQYTLVKNRIRAGLIGDVFYTSKKVQAAVGPTISLKLTSFKVAAFGTAGNLHLNVDHLWGTNNERLLGGGINADIGNLLVIGLSAHRDYHHQTWWLQNSIGLRLSKVKKQPEL